MGGDAGQQDEDLMTSKGPPMPDEQVMFGPVTAPPVPPSAVVERPGLLDRLATALRGGVALVIAPSGHGKTTLLSSWVASLRQTSDVAWLSLRSEHCDPSVFAGHLALTLGPLLPRPRDHKDRHDAR